MSILNNTRYSLKERQFKAFLMNQLVTFLEKHHSTLGTASKFTRTEVIMEETSWSRDEIFTMTREVRDAGELVAHYSGGKNNRWGYAEMLPEDLVTIGVIGASWKPHHKRVLFQQKKAI